MRTGCLSSWATCFCRLRLSEGLVIKFKINFYKNLILVLRNPFLKLASMSVKKLMSVIINKQFNLMKNPKKSAYEKAIDFRQWMKKVAIEWKQKPQTTHWKASGEAFSSIRLVGVVVLSFHCSWEQHFNYKRVHHQTNSKYSSFATCHLSARGPVCFQLSTTQLNDNTNNFR